MTHQIHPCPAEVSNCGCRFEDKRSADLLGNVWEREVGRLLAQPDVQEALLTCQVRCNSDCGSCNLGHCLLTQFDHCARDASHVPSASFDRQQPTFLGKICTCAVAPVQILCLQHCRHRSCAKRIRYQCNARRFVVAVTLCLHRCAWALQSDTNQPCLCCSQASASWLRAQRHWCHMMRCHVSDSSMAHKPCTHRCSVKIVHFTAKRPV